jgi:hypothetical protein
VRDSWDSGQKLLVQRTGASVIFLYGITNISYRAKGACAPPQFDRLLTRMVGGEAQTESEDNVALEALVDPATYTVKCIVSASVRTPFGHHPGKVSRRVHANVTGVGVILAS